MCDEVPAATLWLLTIWGHRGGLHDETKRASVVAKLFLTEKMLKEGSLL